MNALTLEMLTDVLAILEIIVYNPIANLGPLRYHLIMQDVATCSRSCMLLSMVVGQLQTAAARAHMQLQRSVNKR